jgi:hypothetical protein
VIQGNLGQKYDESMVYLLGEFSEMKFGKGWNRNGGGKNWRGHDLGRS